MIDLCKCPECGKLKLHKYDNVKTTEVMFCLLCGEEMNTICRAEEAEQVDNLKARVKQFERVIADMVVKNERAFKKIDNGKENLRRHKEVILDKSNQIMELELQVEGMRNCLNCANGCGLQDCKFSRENRRECLDENYSLWEPTGIEGHRNNNKEENGVEE